MSAKVDLRPSQMMQMSLNCELGIVLGGATLQRDVLFDCVVGYVPAREGIITPCPNVATGSTQT